MGMPGHLDCHQHRVSSGMDSAQRAAEENMGKSRDMGKATLVPPQGWDAASTTHAHRVLVVYHAKERKSCSSHIQDHLHCSPRMLLACTEQHWRLQGR